MSDILGGGMLNASQEQLDAWHREHQESLRWLEPIYAEWDRRHREALLRIERRHEEEAAARALAAAQADAQREADRAKWQTYFASPEYKEKCRQGEAARRRARVLAEINGTGRLNKERDRRIYAAHCAGRSASDLEYEYGLCRQRIHSICKLQREVEAYRRQHPRRTPGRVIDMGGPRDVWLTWTPQMQAAEFGL